MTTEERDKVVKFLNGVEAMFAGDANWLPSDVEGYTEVAELVYRKVESPKEAKDKHAVQDGECKYCGRVYNDIDYGACPSDDCPSYD